MPQSIDVQDKKATLQAILESKYFKDSQVTAELLAYLADAAVEGHTPKELNIAYDLYKNKNFDPATDSYVRTNVYKLRKKLETYYKNEGARDKTRLRIPRGHYHVEFFIHAESAKKFSKLSPFWVLLFLSLVGNIMLFLFLFSGPKQPHSSKLQTHPFWTELVHSPLPTCFAVSNIVMYMEYDEEFQRDRWIYDTQIYTQDDFDTLRTRYPHRNFAPVEFSFVHMSNIPNFTQIIRIVGDDNKNEIKWSQEVEWQDILNKNIVYVGDIRSLNKLAVIFDHLHVGVELPYIITWKANEGDSLFQYDIKHQKDYRKTYSVITKLPGPQNNVIILILGTGYPARIYTVEQFTSMDNLGSMYQNMINLLGETPVYFEMVLEVQSLYRTGYQSQILHLRTIKPDEFSWNF